MNSKDLSNKFFILIIVSILSYAHTLYCKEEMLDMKLFFYKNHANIFLI